MRLAYDFHIHSALSPCADNDMTPNNIINMSRLKGLDVIAVTDHNSCANLKACMACAQKSGLLVIPGIEVETAEEIHVICLFPDEESALEMQELIYSKLPDIKNRVDIFGEQLILDENDMIIGKQSRLLLAPASITINEVFSVVCHKLGGIAIPAHIDRQANSILSSFGAMPKDINISCIEINDKNKIKFLTEQYPDIINMNKIYSSDAHYLGNIKERENFIEVDALCGERVISVLKNRIYK